MGDEKLFCAEIEEMSCLRLGLPRRPYGRAWMWGLGACRTGPSEGSAHDGLRRSPLPAAARRGAMRLRSLYSVIRRIIQQSLFHGEGEGSVRAQLRVPQVRTSMRPVSS